MVVNLNQPLRWKSANADETFMLNDLQGNILKGHGRRHSAHVFITFKNAAGGKAACHAIAPRLTPALAQLQAAELFKNGGPSAGRFVAFMVSAAGYTAMNVVAAKRPTGHRDWHFNHACGSCR